MSLWPYFVAGLSDSYNPCSIGVLLISLTILIGLGKKNLITLFGVSYLSVIFATYFLIGLGLLRTFHLFGVHGFFGYIAGAILIVIGIFQLLPNRFKVLPVIRLVNQCHLPPNLNKYLDKGVFIAGAILGFLIGLCTVPCAGGIYLGAIALLAINTTFWKGILGLLIFNLGFILPLTLIFLISSRQAVLDWLKKVNVKLAMYSARSISVIMIVMGIILLILARFR
jgi:cytochrome c biogenesis protein CcdA